MLYQKKIKIEIKWVPKDRRFMNAQLNVTDKIYFYKRLNNNKKL